MINGQPLTGEMFARLLEQYVAAFNNGTVPAISTAWEQVLLLELDKVMAASVEEYKKKAAQLSVDHLPMSEEELRKVDDEAKKCAYKKFYDNGLVNIGAERMAAARDRMESAFSDVFDKLYSENYNVSYKDSEDFFGKLYSKIKEQMDQLEILTFDVISSNWQKLREVMIVFVTTHSFIWKMRKVQRFSRSGKCLHIVICSKILSGFVSHSGNLRTS